MAKRVTSELSKVHFILSGILIYITVCRKIKFVEVGLKILSFVSWFSCPPPSPPPRPPYLSTDEEGPIRGEQQYYTVKTLPNTIIPVLID